MKRSPLRYKFLNTKSDANPLRNNFYSILNIKVVTDKIMF